MLTSEWLLDCCHKPTHYLGGRGYAGPSSNMLHAKKWIRSAQAILRAICRLDKIPSVCNCSGPAVFSSTSEGSQA